MNIWLKTLTILTVAFALVGTPNAVLAGCGSCAGDAGHKHEKAATCTKCDHSKTCKADDCQDAAHKADCTCPKKGSKSKSDT